MDALRNSGLVLQRHEDQAVGGFGLQPERNQAAVADDAAVQQLLQVGRGHQFAFVQLTKDGRAGMPAVWLAGAAPRLCAASKSLTRLPCARA